ncbi:uncharacterized protein LOC124607201 isoform X11 [Schistocerca americana]|uniref:uncharacterized protein LOC124607201 isoform X11 n=1 Tax=Schistocerca americana TaxID=7009 RepID=UPI001F4F7498|nr:uncharacterized protein LOC124607201 isoform X11 [Schistocerca americana]XP_049958976.1 uncharacterized protein LOC126475271 isoform X11 [Schistocerca serialis cubense]
MWEYVKECPTDGAQNVPEQLLLDEIVIFFLCCLPFSGDIYFAETFSNCHLNPACFWIFHIKLPSYTIIEYICTGECIGELDYDRKKSHCQQKMMNVTTEVKWNPRGVKVMEQKWQIWKWTNW